MTGETIREMRRRAGLSQWPVAKAIGRGQPWLSNIELGYTVPSEEDLLRLAVAIQALAERKHAS